MTIERIAQLVFLILIPWIVIYPVDSAIQRLNNRDQSKKYAGNVTALLSAV